MYKYIANYIYQFIYKQLDEAIRKSFQILRVSKAIFSHGNFENV